MQTGTSNKSSILAIALLLLILFLYSGHIYFIYALTLLIIICLLFEPVAAFFDRFWMQLGLVLGRISSTIILSAIFYLIVFPLGVVLKLAGKNSLLLSKRNLTTTFTDRNKVFTKSDLQNPY